MYIYGHEFSEILTGITGATIRSWMITVMKTVSLEVEMKAYLIEASVEGAFKQYKKYMETLRGCGDAFSDFGR